MPCFIGRGQSKKTPFSYFTHERGDKGFGRLRVLTHVMEQQVVISRLFFTGIGR
jgi:hypothetical protein